MLRLLLIDDSVDDRYLIIHELRQEFPDLAIEEAVDLPSFNESLDRGSFDVAIIEYCLRWNDGLTLLQPWMDDLYC